MTGRYYKVWKRDRFPRNSKFMKDEKWWDGSGCTIGLHQPYLRRRKHGRRSLGSIWRLNSEYKFKR